MTKIDFLLAGVGGQGVLTASDIIAEVGITVGYEAKKSEVHGFSQRGGVVESHVRWGEQVFAPLAAKGEVDVLLAFEMLEAVRWLEYLQPGGIVIVNRQCIAPMTVTSGDAVYPPEAEIAAALRRATDNVTFVDGLALAESLGNPRLANTVLLGTLSRHLDVAPEVWLSVIEQRVPPRYRELNVKAFWAGRAQTCQVLKT
jgi:indolepyruvate ferredoxin oxidoreductase beta subunit